MDKNESEFMNKLLMTFKIEADEHLKEISKGLLALEKDLPPEDRKTFLEKIFREAHSLKGAARAVSQDHIQDFCQSLENVLGAWKKNEIIPSAKLFDTLYGAIDLITAIIETPNQEAGLKKASDILLHTQKLLDLLSKDDSKSDVKDDSLPNTPVKTSEQGMQETIFSRSENSSASKHSENQNSSVFYEKQEKTIRVHVSKLDSLLQEVEEMLNLKFVASQQASDLRNILKKIESRKKNRDRFESETRTSRHAMEENPNPLISNYIKKLTDYLGEERSFIVSLQDDLNQVIKATDREFRFVGSTVDTLLEDAKKILMQPFSTIFESFPRMVRDLAQSLNKKVNLECYGEDIEVDKRILEELKDPFIHLIRNSIDHGIGTPDQRIENKKKPEGTITIKVSQISGNKIELLFSDDGNGIDIAKVKEHCIKKRIIASEDAETIPDQEVLQLLFHSGISTNEIITELSGRGLGLGIIAEKVEKLGGQIAVESHKGLGTSFKIILPSTLATFRGILVEVSGQQYIVPTYNVMRVLRENGPEIKHVENKKVLTIDDRVLPVFELGTLLGIRSTAENEEKKPATHLSIVVIKANDRTIALEVEKIYREKDILVKGLGKLLPHVRNIVAATITERGKVIAILNPQELIKTALTDYRVKTESAPETGKQTVLLCEDSITVRMLLFNILNCSGYNVKPAVDGEEGFSIFEKEKIDLVITDIEMPRLDGFSLAEKIRATEKGRHIPIILCTSRESREDKERGIKAGANVYLEKSSFTQSNLVDVIRKLL